MRKWAVLVSVSFFVAFVGLIALAPKGDSVPPPSRDQVVSNLGQTGMLESDQQMLDQMRTTVSPNMKTMIDHNPMWTDPSMIRLQEEYQAQLDRMIGRHRDRP